MTEPKRYRKIPIELTAMRFFGDTDDLVAVYQWVEKNTLGTFEPTKAILSKRVAAPKSGISIDPRDGRVILAASGRIHHVNIGDWIVQNDRGYFYPTSDERFVTHYEEMPHDPTDDSSGQVHDVLLPAM